jgi:heat shock protein HspQ
MGESILTNFNVGDIVKNRPYGYLGLVIEVTTYQNINVVRIQPLNYGNQQPFWVSLGFIEKVS